MRLALSLFLAASLLGGIGPASAERQGPRLATPDLIERAVARGRLDRATGDLYLAYALGAPDRLPDRFVSHAPWDGTVPLLHLRERVSQMAPGPDRAAIRSVLESSVPGDCSGEIGGPDTHSSTYFHIEYTAALLGGGLTITNYATSLDTSWNTEVNSFGWAAPPLHPSPALGGKYHVVVAVLGPGLYGFVSNFGTYAGNAGNNPNTSWNEGDAQYSCMALNNDYSAFPGTPQQALDATTAHEFNHSIQFGYGAITGPNEPDVVFTEGGATWMEDEVMDASNDNYNYLWPNFTQSMGEYPEFPYPYWVVFRALTERFGTTTAGGGEQVMEDFWELTSQSATSIDLNALNTALVNKGVTTLPDAYHAAAIALKFNVACTGGVAYPYCLEEGPAYVAHPGNGPPPTHGSISSVGNSFSGSIQDDYALNWIALPTTGPYSITLQNNDASGGQLRATVACLAPSGMPLTPLPSVVGPSSSSALSSFNPSGCTGAPVVVITNQAQALANPDSSAARSYTLFTAPPGTSHGLTVTVSGNGTVTSSPAGISCPGDCFQAYADGTSVTLSQTPGPGWNFAGWSGDCTGTGGCTVAMTAPRSVTATFTLVPPPPPPLPPPPPPPPPPGPGGGGPPIAKSVALSAKPKKVDQGDRTRLTAEVSPCAGHEGDVVEFYRKSKLIASKASNAACAATLRAKANRTAKYQAVSPQQDADHLVGVSNRVKVRVRPG